MSRSCRRCQPPLQFTVLVAPHISLYYCLHSRLRDLSPHPDLFHTFLGPPRAQVVGSSCSSSGSTSSSQGAPVAAVHARGALSTIRAGADGGMVRPLPRAACAFVRRVGPRGRAARPRAWAAFDHRMYVCNYRTMPAVLKCDAAVRPLRQKIYSAVRGLARGRVYSDFYGRAAARRELLATF